MTVNTCNLHVANITSSEVHMSVKHKKTEKELVRNFGLNLWCPLSFRCFNIYRICRNTHYFSSRRTPHHRLLWFINYRNL